MSTVEFWRGDFGNDYVGRNRVKWADRVPLLRRAIDESHASTFLDVGCGSGWNMLALRSISDKYEMSGLDVNHQALQEASKHGFDVAEGAADEAATIFGTRAADMVIHSGVLIHVAPEDLERTMVAIRDASREWILAIEYEADREQEIDYRGHKGKLWKRPFGKLYQSLGCSVIETGPADGYDRCTYWLMQRP